MGVGFPDYILLDEFGSILWEVFGGPPYHVGSSLTLKSGWRDVDVRQLLDKAEWDKWGFGTPGDFDDRGNHAVRRKRLIEWAFSELGRKITGLPIDFQVQEADWANKEFGDLHKAPRSALGLIPLRHMTDEEKAMREELRQLKDTSRKVLLVIDADMEKHGIRPGSSDDGEWIADFRRRLKEP